MASEGMHSILSTFVSKGKPLFKIDAETQQCLLEFVRHFHSCLQVIQSSAKNDVLLIQEEKERQRAWKIINRRRLSLMKLVDIENTLNPQRRISRDQAKFILKLIDSSPEDLGVLTDDEDGNSSEDEEESQVQIRRGVTVMSGGVNIMPGGVNVMKGGTYVAAGGMHFPGVEEILPRIEQVELNANKILHVLERVAPDDKTDTQQVPVEPDETLAGIEEVPPDNEAQDTDQIQMQGKELPDKALVTEDEEEILPSPKHIVSGAENVVPGGIRKSALQYFKCCPCLCNCCIKEDETKKN